MATTEHAPKTTAAPTTSAAPLATAQGESFDLDGFLGFDPTCEQPGAAKREGLALVIDNFGAAYTAAVAGLIDAVAPTPGSEMEAALQIRIPIEPPLFVTGKLALKASRGTDGKVTATLTGAIGPTLTDGKVGFADFLVGGQLQGEGATAERAVIMLGLALETCVRAWDDAETFFDKVHLVWQSLMLDPISIAILAGYGPADALADFLWGQGHAANLTKTMQKGEAAQMTGSATLGGSASPEVDQGAPTVGAEGAMGMTMQRRIENTGGGAQTTDTPSFIANGSVSIGPFSGGFDMTVPVADPKSLKLTLTGKFAVDPNVAGWIGQYLAWLDGVVAAGSQYLAKGPEGVAEATATLRGLRAAAGGALHGAENALLLGATKLGVSGTIGVEVGGEVQNHQGQISITLVTALEESVPGGSKAGVTQKQLLAGPFAFSV